jgi:hypothetical protein
MVEEADNPAVTALLLNVNISAAGATAANVEFDEENSPGAAFE